MTEKPSSATIDVNGVPYRYDARGNLVPVSAIKPMDLLMDEVVATIIGQARGVSAGIAAFKVETFDAVTALQELIAQQYGTTLGGAKGNITLTSFDGREKVQVQVADLIAFGPELQAAKVLIDGCLAEWAASGRDEIRAIVNRVFQVDNEGKINRAELLSLRHVNITDPRWVDAMAAIQDSIRVIGSRQYVRFYERDAHDAPWRAITIDMAAA